MKMIQQTSESATKTDICYFGAVGIVITILASKQKRGRLYIFGICVWNAITVLCFF